MLARVGQPRANRIYEPSTPRARVAVFLMLLKARLVARHVYGQALFAGQLQRHLHGEAVGVVQVEGALAVNLRAGKAARDLLKLVVALL